jgi:hypothetical protein
VQVARRVVHLKAYFRRALEFTKCARLGAGLTVLLLSFTLICPISRAASKSSLEQPSAGASTSATPSQEKTREAVKWWEIAAIAASALFFAWLRLVKDFRHYKGLLHVLLLSGYTWTFLTSIATGTFILDYLLLPYIERFKMLQPGLIAHLSLLLGHSGVSAAVAYGSPFLLAKLPLHSGGSPGHASERQKPEKTTTEMNAVFESMRESLEGHVNGKLSDWTLEYDWPVLKYAAKTLAVDQASSGAITDEDKDLLHQDVDGYQKNEDKWEDRQKKYELLRMMMSQSSFRDLRQRLKQAGKPS